MHFGVSSCQILRCEAFNSPQITQIQQIYADFLDKSKLFQWKSAEIRCIGIIRGELAGSRRGNHHEPAEKFITGSNRKEGRALLPLAFQGKNRRFSIIPIPSR